MGSDFENRLLIATAMRNAHDLVVIEVMPVGEPFPLSLDYGCGVNQGSIHVEENCLAIDDRSIAKHLLSRITFLSSRQVVRRLARGRRNLR